MRVAFPCIKFTYWNILDIHWRIIQPPEYPKQTDPADTRRK